MSNLLDDLFSWAAQQTKGSMVTVGFTMTTNETTDNVVTYSNGQLTYQPGSTVSGGRDHEPRRLPAKFASAPNGIQQYFSNRYWEQTNSLLDENPFDPNDTNALTVSIVEQVDTIDGAYAINISTAGATYTVTPDFDTATGVIYGELGDAANNFISISLCNKVSVPAVGCD